MERKDPKDMTVSELLRWVANGEADESGNVVVHRKLLSALSGKEYDDSTATEDARNIRAIADKIDAEIEAARCNRLADVVDSCIEMHGYPSRCEGERFDRWLERCFIQRPLDENGEPVRFGDRDIDWESLGEYRDQGIQWDVSAVDARGHILATTADPYKIVAVAKTGERGRVKRTAPEVLGADGLPVVAGETVYTETGLERVVAKVGTVAYDGMEGWDGTPWVMLDNGSWLHAADVTHTPPDTQERIDDDAQKSSHDYWGCAGVECVDCRRAIDGKKPYEYFDCLNCLIAKSLDLLRRQRELDARKGGE